MPEDSQDRQGGGPAPAGREPSTATGRGPSSATGRGPSTLVNRNVFIGSHRTSIRLEPAMWDSLAEICRREDMTLHEVCGLIDARRQASSLTAAIRVFALTYYRAAATEDGHASSGHGLLNAKRRRPRRRLAEADGEAYRRADIS